MASNFTQIDLSRLPAPQVVEALDYETILAAMVADFQERSPDYGALVESDPAMKVLESAAYREFLLRQRVNDAARARMLAFASGGDLEHIGSTFNVKRLEGESDTRLRRRIQLVHESYTAAGTAGAYTWHTLTAAPEVGDATVSSPGPGRVEVNVIGEGVTARLDKATLDKVRARLNQDDVRPLTDLLTVRHATLVPYDVRAKLWLYEGPDARLIKSRAEAAVREYAESTRRIGYDVTVSGLYAALHVAGVQNVGLVSPTETLVLDQRACAVLGGVNLEVVGRDE